MDYKKVNIFLLYGIALFQGMVFYGPIATLYRQAHGLTMLHIGLIESISLMLMIILEVPWGFIADKIGYKRTMVICNVLYFISKLVFWKATGFSFFLIERLMLSVILSGISGCDTAYLYLATPKDQGEKVFGTYMAMGTIGLMLASIIFSVVVKDNYELSAFLTVISYSIAMVMSLFLIDIKPKAIERIQYKKQLNVIKSSLVDNKQFILFLLASGLLIECNQTITVFLNQLQYLRSGILPEHMGYIYILVTASGLLSAYAYKVTGWLGETKTIRILFCVAGVACISMAIWAKPLISVLSIVMLRVAISLFMPILVNIQNRQIKIQERATILSFYSIFINGIAIATNLIFGEIADIGVEYAMVVGGVFCFIGLILYIIWEGKNNDKHIYI